MNKYEEVLPQIIIEFNKKVTNTEIQGYFSDATVQWIGANSRVSVDDFAAMRNIINPYANKILQFWAVLSTINTMNGTDITTREKAGTDTHTTKATQDISTQSGKDTDETNTYIYPDALLSDPDESYIKSTVSNTTTPGTINKNDIGARETDIKYGAKDTETRFNAGDMLEYVDNYINKIISLCQQCAFAFVDDTISIGRKDREVCPTL